MITFQWIAKDPFNPLTDLFERGQKAVEFNNLCRACDNGQFTAGTAQEIYEFFHNGLKYIVEVDASFREGLLPYFGEVYNEESKELIRAFPESVNDGIILELVLYTFSRFSSGAQTEIIQYLAPNKVVDSTAQS